MKDTPASALKTTKTQRRRPAQSRARATADAIREAFVQLLVEKGYEKVSIRQVIGLAGVGIGSFYEYFSSKEALAAVCIHLRIKAIAADMRASIDAHRAEPLPARVDALLDATQAYQTGRKAEILAQERQIAPGCVANPITRAWRDAPLYLCSGWNLWAAARPDRTAQSA
ncbi:MAG: TetR/AcrR family transcriptional regulator [Curvibacter sp.]|nr:MAG: TetR/AcrR family transcriptional regulator [Curvibacter sp.]